MCPSSTRNHTYVARWVKGIVDAGLRVLAVPVAVANSKTELDALEVAWIAYYLSCGVRLVNLAPGGGGQGKGHVVTAETRKKISDAQRGVPKPLHTEQWKRDQSAQKKGINTNTPEHMQRLAEMKRGVPRSQEVRDKISKAQTGRVRGPRSQETKDKLSAAHRGRKRPQHSGAAHHAYLGAELDDKILKLYAEGKPKRWIARHLGVAQPTVSRRLAKIALTQTLPEHVPDPALCRPYHRVNAAKASS